ncbi:serine/threonine-protein kinase [Archangium sp.]|jgi:serine/threonine-protein kinase|uniref:serine/threonine protein kinase n=1 Tax=Archangium sp. TaxID=1872627 RepID=UPI002ED8F907
MTKSFHPDLLQAGDTVRHYRVVRRLGMGGFATVLQVEHEGRLYTMKMAARPRGDGEDEARVDERTFREAVSLGHFHHSNLLAVRELGRWPDLEGGYFFFVTDYVPGATFNPWRWRTHAPLCRQVGVLSELALVLAELHERGVCHRDLKADNVLVREGDDRPFLIDFGAVSLPGAYTLTRALPPMTFHNMAPEVAAFLRAGEWEHGAHLAAHPGVDLYAFGALLYEALTDCHPFNPRLPPEKLLLAIEFLPPVEPVRLDPRVPPGLNALVMRLLAKEPGQRPASARAVHEELMRLLEGEGGTEGWTVPYAFPTARGEDGAPVEARLEEGNVAREGSDPPRESVGSEPPAEEPLPPPPGQEARAASETAGPGQGKQGAVRRRDGRRWALVGLVLGLVLLGLGWGLARTVCASTLGVECPGTASTAPASLAPSEKGRHPLRSSTPKVLRGLLALFCAASSPLLGCASAPVRPDVGGFLERCSPEALATAARLGFDKRPITRVEVEGIPVSAEGSEGDINVRSGPVMGSMDLPDGKIHWVAGELKVFEDRIYIQFDRIYLDALYPERGRVPSPLCAALISGRDMTKFGEKTFEADPPRGPGIDPSKVVHRGPDAAVLPIAYAVVYVQAPGRRFPD